MKLGSPTIGMEEHGDSGIGKVGMGKVGRQKLSLASEKPLEWKGKGVPVLKRRELKGYVQKYWYRGNCSA